MEGFVAPVSILDLSGGKGSQSKNPFIKAFAIVFPVLDQKKPFFIITKSFDMKIIDRVQSPTPTFFKKVRNIGLALAGVSAAILAAPVALPAVLIKVAGYLAVAGGVAGTVSQATVNGE